MKLKSLITKIAPGKKKSSPTQPHSSNDEGAGHHEISFDRRETRIEPSGPVAEIDVVVNSEKINIHTLAPVTKIGRDPAQADIIIPELVVSKLHCTFFSQGNRFFIKDENSTNGVFINNQKITEQAIKNGDIILLGKKGTVKLTFHLRR